jgi:hypothetical protein
MTCYCIELARFHFKIQGPSSYDLHVLHMLCLKQIFQSKQKNAEKTLDVIGRSQYNDKFKNLILFSLLSKCISATDIVYVS